MGVNFLKCRALKRLFVHNGSMEAIKTYATHVEANLARIEIEAAGIPCVVVGVDAAMDGGIAGVRLLVPEDLVERALEILERS